MCYEGLFIFHDNLWAFMEISIIFCMKNKILPIIKEICDFVSNYLIIHVTEPLPISAEKQSN